MAELLLCSAIMVHDTAHWRKCCLAPQCDPAALQANANTVNGAKLPTGLLYGVGGAALVTGVILLATSGSDSDEPSASITPMLGRTTLGLNVAAEF